MQPDVREKPDERLGAGRAAGEERDAFARRARRALPSSTVTSRRAIAGAGSSHVTGQGASSAKNVGQERIVRAGEHDDVGAPPFNLHEARRDLLARSRRGRSARRASAASASARQLRRADQPHVAGLRKALDQLARIVALHRAGRGEHRDDAALRLLRRRLDRRHRADERHGEALPERRQDQRRRGVAGDDDRRRPVLGDELAHQRDDVVAERRLLPVAVGKRRIVGDIDEARLRQLLARRARAPTARRCRNRRRGSGPPQPSAASRRAFLRAGARRRRSPRAAYRSRRRVKPARCRMARRFCTMVGFMSAVRK